MKDKLTKLMEDIDKVCERLLNNDSDVYNELDLILEEIAIIESIMDDEDIINISSRLSSIYHLLNLKEEDISIESLREEFLDIEKKRFEIVNKYIIGSIKISDVDSFKEQLFTFRKKLYAISISDNNLLEVAKMKSKVQHYNTEVLEDEDLLKMAYCNTI